MLTPSADPLSEGVKPPSLDVVIVNWNSGSQLAACLESLDVSRRLSVDVSHVVIVDNASTDQSAETVPPLTVRTTVIRNGTNRGFAAACNQGAALCQADYILFLNPDTRLMAGSLERPIALLEMPEHARIGVIGIQLLDDAGRITRSCAREPRASTFAAKIVGLDRIAPAWFPPLVAEEWDHRESRPVFHVIGAFYLVRRSLWVQLEGFDERFYVYLEDLDFSVRAHRAGWHIYYLSHVQAFHRGGGSSDNVKPARLCLSLHSRIQYVYKHFGWWSATLVLIATLVLEPVVRVARALTRFDFTDVGHTVVGYGLLYRWLVRGIRPRLTGDVPASIASTRPAQG